MRARVLAARITRNPDEDTGYAACKWLQGLGKAHYVPAPKVRAHISCLTGLMSVMTEEETKTVRHVLANLEDLSVRWLTMVADSGRATNSQSAKTYKGRAEWLLKHYIDFCEKPTFDNKVLAGSGPRNLKPKEPPPTVSAEEVATAAFEERDSTPAPAPVPAVNQIRCPLPEGDVIVSLPFERLTSASVGQIVAHLVSRVSDFDVRAAGVIACQLASRGSDFDPARPIGEQMFAPRT